MPNLILDGHKLQWHKDRVEALLRGERVAPIEIEMALTRSCTFKCTYCYGQLQIQEDVGKITKEIAFNFLRDAAEIGVKSIALIGDGESTCVPYFDTFIIYGKSLGLDIACGTNGLLLDRERLQETLPCLTYLRFNISAADKESYKKIHGVTDKEYYKVLSTIKKCVQLKVDLGLPVTIGLQMVLLPEYADQIVPLAQLGKYLGVDYLVIKHCSDDEFGTLGVKYQEYSKLEALLKEAESYSTIGYLVKAKWSKILSGGTRPYIQCWGPPLMIQLSGSGLVAPCGMLFNDRYKEKYHIGNITETRFKDIWKSERYWEVMRRIRSPEFDAKTMCGSLCFQHKINEYLDNAVHGAPIKDPMGVPPEHINFV